MQIQIIGSGDAFGSGGRFNTCLHMSDVGGFAMLLDCGATSLVALNRTGLSQNDIGTILFTHFHGDHFGGLPFFILNAQFTTRRTRPLLIAGPAGIEERARTAMEAAFPGSWGVRRKFEIMFLEITPEAPATIEGVQIKAYPMVHDDKAGPCQGYRVSRDGRVFAFSGDTGWTEALVPLAAGSDLLLIECYNHDFKLPHHLDWLTLRDHLADLGSRRIVITHMGPSMLAYAGDLPVERAHDGLVLGL